MDPLSTDLASLRIDRSTTPPVTRARPSLAHASTSRALRGIALALGLMATIAIAIVAVVEAPRLRALVTTPTVTTTSVIAVSPSSQATSFTSSGYVVAQNTAHVGSKRTGRLARVVVKEGETVAAGDVVAVLDDNDARASIVAARARAATAEARVQTARANFAEAQLQTDREEKLARAGAVALATYEDLEKRRASLASMVVASVAEARAAAAELAPLTAMLADHTLRAPISGVVSSKPLSEGDVITPGGRPVVELFDPSSLVVETDVPEARLSLAHPGAPCEITLDAFPTKHFRGEVLAIGQKVDRAKATIVVKVRFLESANGALNEMAARTNFLTSPLTDAQKSASPARTVTAGAVVERDGRKAVFVVEGEKVRRVAVVLGETHGGVLDLLSGPPAGAKIVADPPPELEDGHVIHEKRD
jgi:HlyD family secretion protein